MEKRKKIIEAANGEIPLPEAIIQHIQSFLSGKQAAQTTILSKTWYSAWSTRPNLDFDQRDFNRGEENPKSIISDGFSEFTKKTMQRYEELNLKIESFRLWMNSWNRDSYSLANELIVKAMKMGATDLNFKLFCGTSTFVLPHEVLESKTLIRLSVNGCRVGRGVDGKVSCSGLKYLILHKVHIEGNMILDIISSCPLIEELVLSECKCFVKVQRFYRVTTKTRMLALSPSIEFGKQNVGSVVDGPINLCEFHKLTCLFLEKVKIGTLFFSDFTSKFPRLKDLTVHHCFGYKEIRIYSHSLECISFAQKSTLKANFDVPIIRKFNFSGSSLLPSLSFTTASREWESDISIKCNRPSTSWFVKLNKFLTNLSLSRIFFSLDFILEESSDYALDIQDLPKPVVENLMLLMDAPSSVCSVLLDGLFSSCRPMFITQYWLPKSCIGLAGNANNNLLELLCKTLVQEGRENCCTSNRNTLGLHDLEEVNVEILEESLAEWRPLSWKTLLDASAIPESKRIIRFQLGWGLTNLRSNDPRFHFC